MVFVKPPPLRKGRDPTRYNTTTCGLWKCYFRGPASLRGAILARVSTKQAPPKNMRRPSRDLETFPNPNPDRDYTISFETSEFTCLCPKTGQPDFATIRVQYIPDRLCVELKSWKLYLWSFRDEGGFHEAITNRILDDLVAATRPRWAHIEGDFNIRGGIHTTVLASYEGSESDATAALSEAKVARSSKKDKAKRK